MDKRKILIDCDTGTDDAIAIIAALYADNIDLVGLTAVNGNVPLQYTAQNTIDIVHYLGFNTPVAVGACAPLKPHIEEHIPDGTHGNTGLGSIVVPHTDAPFSEKSASEFILDAAQKAGGALEIVAIGPLTNLAIAFLLYPQLKGMVKHIWVMGGAAVGGNVNTTAEFNIWTDPEAARLVFAAGVPLTMVGLDVTEKAVLDENDAKQLRALGTRAGDLTAALLDFMFVRRDEGNEDAQMHDALALAAALCPGVVGCEHLFVDVECEGTYTFGHTAVDLKKRLGRPANVDVALRLDLPRFKEWLHGCIARSAGA